VLVWAPRSGGVAMSVAIFSYAGEITVGFSVDAGLVPDPEKIVTAFERELAAVLRLKPRRGGRNRRWGSSDP
jgi:diacylglycerol O-acyltransferase / wax synthase